LTTGQLISRAAVDTRRLPAGGAAICIVYPIPSRMAQVLSACPLPESDEAGTAVALSLLSRFMRHRLPMANAGTRRNINRLRRLLEACGERDPVCYSLLEFDRTMAAFRRLENF
jgi:hypothetical protein